MKLVPIEPDCFYHIYNRGNNKEDIFLEDKNYEYFLLLLKKHLFPIADVFSYCLLKNHFHILLRIRDEKNLPVNYINNLHKPFSNLFNAYTKSINKLYGRVGSLFQKPFNRIKIFDEFYLKQLVAYIHLNPVKHKFTNDFKNYKYSSYQSFIQGDFEFINGNLIVDYFEDLDNFQYWHNVNKLRIEAIIEEIDNLDKY